MKNRRFAALFLAICLTIPMIVSCSGDTSAEKTGAKEQIAEETRDKEQIAEETRVMHEVPKQDFGGETFHSYAFDWQGYSLYFYADEQTGDAMNDAIFSRTIQIEEYLNVDMKNTLALDFFEQVDTVQNLYKAQDDTYQEVLLHCIYGVESLATEGYLYNYDSLPYLNMSAEWWNREQMDVLKLGKNTYFGISDYMVPCPYVIFVNRDLVEDYNLDDPYQMVFEKKWTLDNCFDMITSIVTDLDGDGKYTEDDIWGITAEELSKYVSFATGAGQYVTEAGKDGRIKLAINTEKTVSIVEKLYAVVNTPGAVYVPNDMTQDFLEFDFEKMLFYMDAVSDAVYFRDSTCNVGILPYPMYDESQENYLSLDWGGLQCVMGHIQNPELVGAVLELQAYYSAKTVIPAYYDVLLAGKIARDADTVKMLDIVFDTITYEVSGNYFGFSAGFDDLFFTLGYLVVQDKSADFASHYARLEPHAQNVLANFYECLDSVENQ